MDVLRKLTVACVLMACGVLAIDDFDPYADEDTTKVKDEHLEIAKKLLRQNSELRYNACRPYSAKFFDVARKREGRLSVEKRRLVDATKRSLSDIGDYFIAAEEKIDSISTYGEVNILAQKFKLWYEDCKRISTNAIRDIGRFSGVKRRIAGIKDRWQKRKKRRAERRSGSRRGQDQDSYDVDYLASR